MKHIVSTGLGLAALVASASPRRSPPRQRNKPEKEFIMKKHILRLTIGLTALVANFLPQKAEACRAECDWGWCEGMICTCVWKLPVCIGP